MVIIINTDFLFANVNWEAVAVASLYYIRFSWASVFLHIGSICDEKNYYMSLFLYNCTYLTFDLTMTLT